MKQLYYIVVKFMNDHRPSLVGITDDPEEFMARFIDTNGYTSAGDNAIEHHTEKSVPEWLWVGYNHTKLDCKLMAIPVKPTPTFWLTLNDSCRMAMLSR